MKNLAVCVPWQHELVPTRFMWDLWRSDIPRGAGFFVGSGGEAPANRNQAVRRALECGAEQILLLDVDQSVPRDVMARLSSHGVDIISAPARLKTPPHQLMLYRRANSGKYWICDPEPGLQEVDAVGGGCLLVDAGVFRKIPGPWFSYCYDPKTFVMTGGDDLRFCALAKEHGFKVYADSTIDVSHFYTVGVRGVKDAEEEGKVLA